MGVKYNMHFSSGVCYFYRIISFFVCFWISLMSSTTGHINEPQKRLFIITYTSGSQNPFLFLFFALILYHVSILMFRGLSTVALILMALVKSLKCHSIFYKVFFRNWNVKLSLAFICRAECERHVCLVDSKREFCLKFHGRDGS